MWRKDFLLNGTYLWKTIYAESYLCFWLALLHSVSDLFFLQWSNYLSLCTFFDSISSNIEEFLLINPSANVFVFGDFNVHHKDRLSYSGGTDRPSEICSHFSILNYLIQMVSFPTWIPDRDTHSAALLDYFFLLTLVFLLQWLSLHREILTMFVVSVSIDFSSNSKWDVPIHHITCGYSCEGWNGLGDHLRDVPW